MRCVSASNFDRSGEHGAQREVVYQCTCIHPRCPPKYAHVYFFGLCSPFQLHSSPIPSNLSRCVINSLLNPVVLARTFHVHQLPFIELLCLIIHVLPFFSLHHVYIFVSTHVVISSLRLSLHYPRECR